MAPKQTKKKSSQPKKRKPSSSGVEADDESWYKHGKTTASSNVTGFITTHKTTISTWGCLPIVLFLLWSSTSSSSSVNGGRGSKNYNGGNHSPLESVLDKVVEIGRKTLFYDSEFSFEIVDRTVQANAQISKGSLILDIPRDAQIWHTDALLDPFIRYHLFSAKHAVSGELVDHRAYLAVYLAMHSQSNNNANANANVNKNANKNDLQSSYLNYLPKEQDYESHPVLQTTESLAKTFGEHSMTYNLIRRRQIEWESEYQAFCKLSPLGFASLIPRVQDYLVARIHVASRSFTTMTVPKYSDLGDTTSSADLDLYLQALGYDYAKDGFVVMVPILDALDHHLQQHNVDYRYNPDSRSFSLFASRDIAGGMELVTNYGSKVDPWLFANYGFVNVDGSGRTGATLAAFHTIHHETASVPSNTEDQRLESFRKSQRRELLPYFQYDDGYNHCIFVGQFHQQKGDQEILEFKRIKMSYLEIFVNQPEKWMVSLPPRNETTVSSSSSSSKSLPSYSSSIIESLDQEDGMMGILSTCRLLALTPQDYQGRAKAILAGLLEKYRLTGEKKFRMIPGGPALEFRARAWLKRLAMAELEQYQKCPTTSSSAVEEEFKILTTSTKSSQQEIMEAHVRLGELQTLELLIQYANGYLEANREDGEQFTIRNEPCPASFSESLMVR